MQPERAASQLTPCYEALELRRFGAELLLRIGLTGEAAEAVAETLVEGDLLGHATHGLVLLAAYLRDIDHGLMRRLGQPTTVADHGSVVTWDGDYLPGPWLVRQALDLALARIARHKLVTIVVRRSHHIGCLAASLRLATERGYLILLTTSDPSVRSVAPHGGITGCFTPNPIAAGIPTGGDPILLDICASTTTNGMAKKLSRAGGRLPGAWMIDSEGHPTNDPKVLFDETPGAILPLGGLELGHKGFALALVVEALTAALGGHGRADRVTRWGASVFLQLIDPDGFGGRAAFERESGWLAEVCRSARVPTGAAPVRLPGEGGLRLRRQQLLSGVQIEPAEDQAAVSIGYINDFTFKIEPLLNAAKWEKISDNKRLIKYKTPDNRTPFIKIVICTPKGMNSLHANFLFLDELDLADPAAIKQGVNIARFSRGFHGIKVYLSTRKYAFGNMQAALDKAPDMNYKVLAWNILDVTEACPPSRHKPDLPKQDMFVAKNLPLVKITGDEFNLLPDLEKGKYEMVPNAHAGCIGCKLLPVCKKRLSEKPQTATGGFYKPISSVIQSFAENDVEIAEAELMCWKPGSQGLVYPRYSDKVDTGNVVSLRKAYEILIGNPAPKNVTPQTIYGIIKTLDLPVYAGVDWGFTHDAAIVVMVRLPNGEVWIIDCFTSPKLEIQDLLPVAINIRDKYKPMKWYCDTNMPAYVKAFSRNGMTCPKFTKDVPGGIGAVRSKIMTATGERLLKVLEVESTKKVRTALQKHKFVLDGQGQITMNPDDVAGIADICDTVRYLGQNMFPISGPQRPNITSTDPNAAPDVPEEQKPTQEQHELMKKELAKAIGGPVTTGGTGKRGGFHWSM